MTFAALSRPTGHHVDHRPRSLRQFKFCARCVRPVRCASDVDFMTGRIVFPKHLSSTFRPQARSRLDVGQAAKELCLALQLDRQSPLALTPYTDMFRLVRSINCLCVHPQIVVHAVRRAVDELGTASWADPQAVLAAQTLRWDGGVRAVDIGSHNLMLHAAGKWGYQRPRGHYCRRRSSVPSV